MTALSAIVAALGTAAALGVWWPAAGWSAAWTAMTPRTKEISVTDYNDGKWHGWNGGECPVDPDSLIVCAYRSCSTDATGQYAGMGTRADLAPWSDVIAFRVTKPAPPKQREYWVTCDDRGKLLVFDRPVRADVHEVIHVREVLPE